MTNIRILSNSGELCGYEVTGHTGYAPQGKDILCAALSMLSITCANAIEKIAGVKPQIYMDDNSGTLLLRLRPTQLSATTDTILMYLNWALSSYKKTILNTFRFTKRRNSNAGLNLQLFASKKGVGSSRNGRDSISKRLGVKRGTVSSYCGRYTRAPTRHKIHRHKCGPRQG